MDGGIWGLLGLIRDHRGAVEYDFRQRFGLGLRDIGDRLSASEAARLAVILRADPSSMIAAAIEGWGYPISRETTAILDLYDLEHAKASNKARPHPGRPWLSIETTTTVRRGDTGGRTPEEIKRILREQFGQPEAGV